MPGVRNLGDVLKSQGYNLKLIQGSDIHFGGTDHYFNQHGNYEIVDYNEMKNRNYIDKDYFVWWGVEDKKVLDISKKEILDLASKNEPFAVSVFTLDTHFVDGYLDESCPNVFDDQLSNVYNCSSLMMDEFINWVKNQDFYENTTVVIMGDHTLMQNEYFNNYPFYDRRVYNVFLNSYDKPFNSKNRQFTMLDMYPTILSSIGVEIEGEKLGFGVNLFSEKKTLLEEIGYDKLNNELLRKSKYYIDNIQHITLNDLKIN